jgi:carbon-monoxide dehydrogenase medium subunit
VKPAPFKYVAVDTVDEAVEALAEHGDDAKVLAGGQSLVPLMNMRLAQPAVLVDINGVQELDGIRANGTLEVGAITRQLSVQRSQEVARTAPLVVDALRHVSHTGVRSRGTLGGTIAHADPAAEIPAVLLALGGEVVARGRGGERTIPADDLFESYFTTTLAANELLTAVRVPGATDGMRFGFREVARKAGDFALAGAAVAIGVGPDGTCAHARVALFGVADRPIRSAAAEAALAGRSLAAGEVRAEAGRAAASALEAKSDGHASAAYRKEVTAVVVRRALEAAANGGRAR